MPSQSFKRVTRCQIIAPLLFLEKQYIITIWRSRRSFSAFSIISSISFCFSLTLASMIRSACLSFPLTFLRLSTIFSFSIRNFWFSAASPSMLVWRQEFCSSVINHYLKFPIKFDIFKHVWGFFYLGLNNEWIGFQDKNSVLKFVDIWSKLNSLVMWIWDYKENSFIGASAPCWFNTKRLSVSIWSPKPESSICNFKKNE